MITQKKADKVLQELVSNKSLAYAKWAGSKFETMKLASTTEKGDIGEDFLKILLENCNFKNVKVLKGRRGDYDVSGDKNGKSMIFEVKVATRDVHGSFQFNGIRYDRKYTHLFCLGISPDKARFVIIPKSDIVTSKYTMVSMAKGSNASFKLTQRESNLLPFSEFDSTISDQLRDM